MTKTHSPPTVVLSDEDKQHILDLSKDDGDEYGKFIKSIIDEFKPLNPNRKLSGTRESKTLEDIEDKIKSCLGVESIVTEVIDDNLGKVSVVETLIEGNISSAEKFFQVKLTYEQYDLHILIHKSSLYLVGYRREYKPKKEEATVNKDDKGKIDDNAESNDDETEIDDNAECWIILSEEKDVKTTAAAVEYLKQFQTSYEPKKVKLGPSYQSLISAFVSDFETKKQKVLVTNLYNKLTNRMKVLINGVEKTEYAVQILETVKQTMETGRGKEETYERNLMSS